MYVGIGIFMLVLGAILRYAVNWKISGLSLHTVGNILMIGGGLSLLISLVISIMNRRRAGYTSTHTQSYDPATGTATERTDVDPY